MQFTGGLCRVSNIANADYGNIVPLNVCFYYWELALTIIDQTLLPFHLSTEGRKHRFCFD